MHTRSVSFLKLPSKPAHTIFALYEKKRGKHLYGSDLDSGHHFVKFANSAVSLSYRVLYGFVDGEIHHLRLQCLPIILKFVKLK